MFEKALSPEDFNCDRETTCCFTGHRKRGLPHEGDPFSAQIKALRAHLSFMVQEAYDKGYRTFITGMADGFDMYAAAEVIALKAKHNDIRLVCAVPYPGQIKEMKSPADRFVYNLAMRDANEIVIVNNSFFKDCYRQRNLFMVEHSSLLIAAADLNSRSGSVQTVNMAKRANIPVMHINTAELPYNL